jgi:N-acetylmuramidase/Putative peptidoglycan binding domain
MTLQLNDRGDAVKDLQTKLGLTPDGHFGPATKAAVTAFQTKNGLTADGVAGPITLAKLLIPNNGSVIKGPDKLTTADFIAAGQFLRCHPGMVEALALKETHGAAYLPDGRPKILFERHQFYKRLAIVRGSQTQVQATALRNKAFAEASDICNPSRGGYKGGAVEYDRLARAQQYSITAAQESASWGQFQVMGFNAVPIGYSSVQEFVDQMHQGIDKHLLSLTRFIKATPKALKGIREQDFALLAHAYNGPAYKENGPYDVDLKEYFEAVKNKY